MAEIPKSKEMSVGEISSLCKNYILENGLATDAPFHNFGHLEDVVHHAEEFSREECLTTEEQADVVMAAWFHDTSHAGVKSDVLEDENIDRACSNFKKFASDQRQQNGFITQERETRILDLIRSTRHPYTDANRVLTDPLAMVLRDADNLAIWARVEFAEWIPKVAGLLVEMNPDHDYSFDELVVATVTFEQKYLDFLENRVVLILTDAAKDFWSTYRTSVQATLSALSRKHSQLKK